MIRYRPGVNGAWTATCTRCGEGSPPYPAKSMARAWGESHAGNRCGASETGGVDRVDSGQPNGPEPVRQHQPGPSPSEALTNGRGAPNGT